MKETRASIRLVAMILCAAVVLTGMAFVVTIGVNRERWINRAYNTRLADAKKTTVQGTIYDSEGVVLAASSAPGERHYIADTALRRALSHVIGDQTNMSATGVENFHASTLLGFTSTQTGYMLQKLAGYDPVGNSIRLTVNAELCRYMAEVFPKGKRGAVVLINYKTGAILGKASLPAFDPANMGQYVEDTAYYDRVLQTRYAPGSTFKIVTLTAALENVEGAASEKYRCEGVWNYAGNTLKCAGGAMHGDMTLPQAFAKSCNIAFGSLAFSIGAPALKATAEQFGFNYDFAFDDVILYESRCLQNSTGGELIQAGIGQGRTEVTPLHMAMIAGAIANGGNMMEPRLISAVLNPAGAVIRSMQPGVFRTVASQSTCETVARYMYETVKSGTGTRAAISGYKAGYVCGKTGSAEWSNDKEAATHAWFTGFLYGDEAHPYAIAVIVEEGGSGGTVAAPIAAKVFKKAMDLGLY